MRLSVVPVAVLGLVAAAAAFSVAGRSILSSSGEAGEEFALELPTLDELEQPPDAPDPLAAIRPVAPEMFAPPRVEQAELLRVEERPPLSPIGRAPDPRDMPPSETILHRPVATAAGAFEAMGHHVALAGIEVTDAAERCAEGDAAWPCGIHARTAFRTWLRGRALTCVVRPVPVGETVVSDCRVGNADPAEWLAAQGWVRATPGGPYEALQAEAESKRRGLFGPAPSSSLPVIAPAPQPAE